MDCDCHAHHPATYAYGIIGDLMEAKRYLALRVAAGSVGDRHIRTLAEAANALHRQEQLARAVHESVSRLAAKLAEVEDVLERHGIEE